MLIFLLDILLNMIIKSNHIQLEIQKLVNYYHNFKNNFTLNINKILFEYRIKIQKSIVTTEGFEPSPFRNSALNYRLRPLGQIVIVIFILFLKNINQFH